MNYLFAPLLLLLIIVGYVAVVLGLAVLYFVAGPFGAVAGILALFITCLYVGTRNAASDNETNPMV